MGGNGADPFLLSSCFAVGSRRGDSFSSQLVGGLNFCGDADRHVQHAVRQVADPWSGHGSHSGARLVFRLPHYLFHFGERIAMVAEPKKDNRVSMALDDPVDWNPVSDCRLRLFRRGFRS